jgi:hypothetical protein
LVAEDRRKVWGIYYQDIEKVLKHKIRFSEATGVGAELLTVPTLTFEL